MSGPDTPGGPDPRLVDLALHVVDDTAVDWESARETSTDLSETVERLRQIESLASEHRRARAGVAHATEPAAFRWGPLRVIERIGAGGYGEVWRAWDTALDREVALKLRRGDLSSDGTTRWLREARRLARVRHPHVVTVFGADVHDGRPGLATELVRGRTLEQRLLAEGPCGAAEAALIGVDLCAALAAVHAAGLIHGDVKTRNVMREGAAGEDARLAGSGRIVLMDFGSAAERALDDHADGSGGTPLYAAPELLEGAPASIASDLYALGVVLFRLVTARFPIEAVSVAELRDKLARDERASLRTLRPDLPAAFVRTIERALARDPAARFRDAAAMEAALAEAIGAATTRAGVARGARPLALAGALLAGAALVALAWFAHGHWAAWSYRLAQGPPAGHPVAASDRQLLLGHEIDGEFGAAVLCPGDLDGDGIPDLAVGAPGEADDRGRVYVYRGRADGGFEPWLTLSGAVAGSGFGRALAAGDLDGDGHPDLVVGAHTGVARSRSSGVVYVFPGGPGMSDTRRLALHGDADGQDFGFSLAVGDVNGDHRPDLLVGAPLDAHGGVPAGRVFIYLGGARIDTLPDLQLASGVPHGQFGVSVCTPGDLDGDGQPDIVVGANWDGTGGGRSGRVYVYPGGASLRNTPSLVLDAPEPDCWFGVAVCSPGDMDGDGYPDLAVGAEFANGSGGNNGAVYVYRGGPGMSRRPAMQLRGGPETASYGSRLTALGDVTGDGRPSLGLSGYSYPTQQFGVGLVEVFSGGAHWGGRPDLRQLSASPAVGSGVIPTALPDLDHDGLADLAVGEPADGRLTPGAGVVRIVRVSRYQFVMPATDARLERGSRLALHWLGAEPADLAWSADDRHWTTVARHVGGSGHDSYGFTAPEGVSGAIRLRLTPSDPRARGAAISAPITLVAR